MSQSHAMMHLRTSSFQISGGPLRSSSDAHAVCGPHSNTRVTRGPAACRDPPNATYQIRSSWLRSRLRRSEDLRVQRRGVSYDVQAADAWIQLLARSLLPSVQTKERQPLHDPAARRNPLAKSTTCTVMAQARCYQIRSLQPRASHVFATIPSALGLRTTDRLCPARAVLRWLTDRERHAIDNALFCKR
jgi:hypothetical protein